MDRKIRLFNRNVAAQLGGYDNVTICRGAAHIVIALHTATTTVTTRIIRITTRIITITTITTTITTTTTTIFVYFSAPF